MRLSPVLVAVFAVSATFGLSNSANGQTSEPTSGSSQNPLGTSDQVDLAESQLGRNEGSLTVNSVAPVESFPLIPDHSVDEIALQKTKATSVGVSLPLAQSLGKIAASSLQNSGSFSFGSETVVFNKSKSLVQPLLSIEPSPSETSVVLPPEISLNKSKNTTVSERQFAFNSANLAPEVFPINDSEELDLPENGESATENPAEIDLENLTSTPDFVIVLNKPEPENFSLNDTLVSAELEPESQALSQPETLELTQNSELELNKLETEKLAFGLTETQVQTSEILLNKYQDKIASFSASAAENEGILQGNGTAIAVNFHPESSLDFSPNLNKDEAEKIAQFPIVFPEAAVNPEQAIAFNSPASFNLNKPASEKLALFTGNVIIPELNSVSTSSETLPGLQVELNKSAIAKPNLLSFQSPVEIAQTAPPPETPQTLPPPPPPPASPVIPIPTAPAQTEPEVLVAEVAVAGTDNTALIDQVYNAISTVPGRTATRSQLQQDINAIFATGFFRNVRAVPEDTPLGVRVTFDVEPNPALSQIVIEGDTALPPEVIQESFEGQVGEIINLNEIEEGVKRINQWYQENGYVLAQIVAAPEVTRDGVVTLQVAEGVIEDIQVRFLNSDGEATDEEGNPIDGKTRDFIITREIQLKPGDVFNQQTAQRDLARVFGLGIFEDVRLELEPGKEDPRKATLIVNVIERTTGSLAFGGGISSASGLFGTASYQEQNLGGNNQRLGVELEVGNRVFQTDISFTDPWIAGDPYRTSYTVNIFRRRTISVVFENGERDVRLENGDRPRVVRTGGGINFTRPFAENVFADPNWVASLGLQYQRVETTDSDGESVSRDEEGNQLTYSGGNSDDLLTVQFAIVRDRRNNRQQPTSGYLFRFGTEQSIPVGSGSILMNRLRAGYTFYIPTNFFSGFVPEGPQTLAFNFQGGTVLGNLPPYEAFPLGGTNSVRGWEEGAIASTRSFIQASIEYRFPVFSNIVGGALFVDAATDLNSQGTVPGSPGGVRDKPGSGLGYGAGIRLQTPLGPIRLDYGINNNGDNRIHFGLGERF